jgi:hypothetical protein
MFGTRPSDRLIEFEDFYLPPGTNEAALTELQLWIEAKIEFPNPDAGEGENGIAECFRHMAVDGPNGSRSSTFVRMFPARATAED